MKRREGRREKEKGLRNALPSFITSARVPQAGVCAICASVCVCVCMCALVNASMYKREIKCKMLD